MKPISRASPEAEELEPEPTVEERETWANKEEDTVVENENEESPKKEEPPEESPEESTEETAEDADESQDKET